MQPIPFGDDGQAATRELVSRFGRGAGLWGSELPGHAASIEKLRAGLGALQALDRQYGGFAKLELEGLETLVASILSSLAQLESEAKRRGLPNASREVAALAIGVALWAIRHAAPIPVVEPVANALALHSNEASTREALAAAFGLMQAVIAHVKPRLAADLERSDPERPWRILHLNFAITAIRTEDPALIDFAFDALDEALPDERGGFYAEALALALGPRIAPAVRERIAARHAKWTKAD